MKKKYAMVSVEIKSNKAMGSFVEEIDRASGCGFDMESCGMTGETAFAIMSKKEKSEGEELLEAARKIADFCEKIGGACTEYNDGAGCPLFDLKECRCKAACRNKNNTAPKYWVIGEAENANA